MPAATKDILLIGHDPTLVLALQDAGFVVACVDEDADLYRAVGALQPTAILLHADSPSRDTLEHLASLSRRYPQPALLLHSGQDVEVARQALDLGISAYVSEGLSATAMRALIEVSLQHARQIQSLRKELARSQRSLAERKLIDAAKCQLMEVEGLNEGAAYQRLKTIAMNTRISIGAAARALLQGQDS